MPLVWAAIWPIKTSGAVEASALVLWCSATQ